MHTHKLYTKRGRRWQRSDTEGHVHGEGAAAEGKQNGGEVRGGENRARKHKSGINN